MALTVKVNGTQKGLVHKASNHFAKNTAPDVCKTPSPGGPVPIPYPVIISKSSDLKNGTSTVKADGGQMIAVKDCEYASCNGDEAGTAGGVVSNTNMKEAKFILYSFDVKMEGKNACRLGDKMTMNHQNTVCLSGTFPTFVAGKSVEQVLQKMVCDCEQKTSNARNPGESKKAYCLRLGDDKHTCVDKEIRKHQEKGKSPKIGCETGWDDYWDEANQVRVFEPVPYPRSSYMRTSGSKWPDATSIGPDGPEQCFDFKFKCPASKSKRPPGWGRGQRKKYAGLTQRWVGKERAKTLPPVLIHNMNCP